MHNSIENSGVGILADVGSIYTVRTLVTELIVKHKFGSLIFITLVGTVLLAGCGMSATDKLKDGAKDDTAPATKKIVANIISNPGDIISSEEGFATEEVVNCTNAVEIKVLVSVDEAGGKIEAISTEANKPIKLALTTLEPVRVELPGSQYALVHTQRGVNIFCLVYNAPGEFKVIAQDKTLLTVEVLVNK